MGIVACLVVIALAGCGDKPAAKGGAGSAKDVSLHPTVTLETGRGKVTLEIDLEAAPITGANFLRYAADDFYDGTIIHRVSPGSTIHGGAFTAVAGTSDLKMQPQTEGLRPPIRNEWPTGLAHERGTIAMVHQLGVPDSTTSEFFINLRPNPGLDSPQVGPGYAVIGKVVEGMDIIDRIATSKLGPKPGARSGSPASVPLIPIFIISTKVSRDYDPDAVAALVQEREDAAKEKENAIVGEKEMEIEEFAAKTAEELGVEFHKLASGLRYAILREGDGPMPASPQSKVEVHYAGWFLDGTEFDSSYSRGAPATFPLDGVIAGWTEGVGQMKVGEKRKFIIPSDLAYGDMGRPGIPPKSTLVFDVELLALK